MKKWVGLVVVLLVAASSVANADVKSFVDRIKAANPTDRWMPAGEIEFVYARDEPGNSYTMFGTVSHTADSLLFKRRLMGGEPRLAVDLGDNRRNGDKVAEELVISATPQATIIYTPTATGNSMSIWRNTAKFGMNMLSIYRVGTLPSRFLDDVSSDKWASFNQGNTLTTTESSGRRVEVTCDDAGRVKEVLCTDGGVAQRVVCGNFIEIGGKSLAQEVTVTTDRAGVKAIKRFGLTIHPGMVSAGAFVIQPGYGTIVREWNDDGRSKPTEYYLTDSGKPLHEELASATNKQVNLDFHYEAHSCDHQTCFFLHECNCGAGCYDWCWAMIEHQRCNPNGNWEMSCDGETAVYYTQADCHSLWWYEGCPEWHCGVSGDDWMDITTDYWCGGLWCE